MNLSTLVSSVAPVNGNIDNTHRFPYISLVFQALCISLNKRLHLEETKELGNLVTDVCWTLRCLTRFVSGVYYD